MLRGRAASSAAKMNIPVFHDDQHGTAIIVGRRDPQRAGTRRQEDLKTSRSSPPARAPPHSPASTCWSTLGAEAAKTSGSATSKASSMKAAPTLMDRLESGAMRRKPTTRTLADVIGGADVFLGLSAAGRPEAASMVKQHGRPARSSWRWPIPTRKSCRKWRAPRAPDAMICTGRSDFPNQVNNVLCFPYIFRGALDCGATRDQRGNEDGGSQGHRRARPRGAVGRRRPRVLRRDADLRPELPHPLALRSAPDPAHRAGGRQGRHGNRRRRTADRRFRRLSRPAEPLRFPFRPRS